MKRISLALVLLSLGLWIRATQAGPLSLERIALISRVSVIVPQEWDGIWATQDSIYDCAQNALFVPPAGSDTLCGGKDYEPDGLTCTGTATTTTVDMTCDGTQEPEPDCEATVHQEIHGTRTGDTYFLVSTTNITYSGTGCTSTDPQCFQVNVHGTRSSSTVPADCAPTPVRRSTWGEVKTTYR